MRVQSDRVSDDGNAAGLRMGRVSAIALAAGESRRMGDVNKLTLPVDGVPLLRRTLTRLLDSELHEIVVVSGHEQATVKALLAGLPVSLVNNGHYAEGRMTSLYCGVQALSEPCDGVMVCLSDQPFLEVGDFNRLMHAYLEYRPALALVPSYRGRRGNPRVLSDRLRDSILGADGKLDCKRLIEENPTQVTTLEMDNDHVLFDLDTPEDYQRLMRHLGSDKVFAANTTAVEGN